MEWTICYDDHDASLTRHPGDQLERPEDAESPEGCQVQLRLAILALGQQHREEAGGNHDEVEDVPGVPEE